MQGRRSAVGSLPDTLGFDHGSTPSDATGLDQQICWNNMQNSSQNRRSDYMPPSITYLNSMNEEEQNLSGWNLGESSSTDIQNQISHNDRKTEYGWSSSMNAFGEVGPILDERRFAPPNNFSLNDASSNLSGNQITNGPLFPQGSVSDSIPQDLNISSRFAGPNIADCQVMARPNTYKSSSSQNIWSPSSSSSSDPFGLPSGSNGFLVEENDTRPGCGLEGNNRISCKRKALEGNVGQSSESGSSNYFQRAEGSVWHGVQSRRNASTGLCISTPSESSLGAAPLGPSNQGLALGVGGVSSECPLPLSASGSGESSRRNLRMRINAPHQQESTPSHAFSTGTAVPHHSSRLFPVNNSLNLRSPLPADTTSPHDSFVAAHVPALRRNQQSSRWNRSSILRPSNSNPGLSGERNAAAPLEEPTTRTMPRNISEHPMFVPAAGMRNSAQNPVNWSVNGGGNVSRGGNVASISRTGSSSSVHPSSAAPNWVPHRNPPHYPRRLVEIVRRSLLANGSESGGQSSNISPLGSGTSASSQEISGEQGHHHLAHSRSAVLLDRQLDGAFGIPYSMRSLAPAGEGGRSRLVSEHIRNVLDIMHRGEGLRFEDVMILDQSVFFGMADIHDRHRDMRLDVDSMSYEELLALEERIGNVNTGVSEETILNRLKRRKCLTSTITDQLEVEPCCVCQEEYKSGEDLGMLECGHDFHTDCIKQWLMQKNLCPICKTTALVT